MFIGQRDSLGSVKRGLPVFILLCVVMALAAGCAGPLKVNYTAGERERAFTDGAGPGIFISPLKDARNAPELEDPKEIGRIEATVFDISGDRLVIENDPAMLTTGALAAEFSAYGYDVRDNPAKADYLLEGELKEFRLDIANRDAVAIALTASVKEKSTGWVIWSGTAEERSDRYAGVMGNSRASIEKYINASLAKVATAVVERAGARVAELHGGGAPVKSVQEKPQTPPYASGTMTISSTPARAKVYIGGVYYGLAPLELKLSPGIYELEVRRKGYRNGKEKVSIRPGETTEVEMELEGE